MNDDNPAVSGSRVMGPLVGFAIGAIVGGAVALLLAPDSGERTRRRLGISARRVRRDARHSVDEVRARVGEAATGLGADVKAAVDAGREAFQHEGAAREARKASRIAHIVVPPSNPSP